MARNKTKKKPKKNSSLPTWAIVLLTALFIIVAFMGINMFFGSASNTGTTTVDEEGNAIVTCAGDITPSLTISAYDKENEGSAITEVFNYRKVGDKVWKAGTTGTALSGLVIDAQYEFVMGINGSDVTDNAYGETFTHKIKCLEDDSIEVPMYNDEIETSLSATFYNEDNNAAAQTFTAGEELDVVIKLQAGTDEFFGNPTLDNPNIIVLKLNSTEWDIPNDLIVNGVSLVRVDTPLRYSSLVASGFTTYAYRLPAVSDTKMEVTLKLNADDSNAPSVDGTAYIYAGGYYIDDLSKVMTGVEDEEGNAVATDAPDSVTLDFTA